MIFPPVAGAMGPGAVLGFAAPGQNEMEMNMINGFQTRYVESVCNQDGRNWVLLTPLIYQTRGGLVYVIPRGARTDGASTPAVIWGDIPPFGTYWQSAVLHDSAYQNTLRRWPAGFTPLSGTLTHQEAAEMPLASLLRDDADLLLREAMELSGVDEITRNVIYQGVKLGGRKAFTDDRR